MKGQHYGIQKVIRGCVQPGMLVFHNNKTWTASANYGGKLYLRTLSEKTRIKDIWVDVLLDGHGNALTN
ncbi:cell division inhibitor protein [Cronobacter sakazakii]|uniref:Kil protein for bacterial septation inhibition n=1 Tax=Cronobacter phage phiES15 TaxID=1168280 RepID=UPI00025F67BC|nr:MULTISPECIES: phage encoded cell division inhibitor protein [Cronobacter]YP_006590014.1 Kil protein for bacterial septation inhibition [Cronobacter phage phiES15]AFH14931.1 prophage Kil protein [Cronobacter phage phiES15]AFJ98440.1 hypothetical protein ES15_0867 [Cronobacter sakazakii ES15]EGT5706179.1 cell division inhibitor protein [Cronobacter sakazakii]EIV2971712.1 cell division inhibitor protein [Cronobacter sakazakii]EJG0809066.1 cell division inhibitor protein [Cronobacter sakazakii